MYLSNQTRFGIVFLVGGFLSLLNAFHSDRFFIPLIWISLSLIALGLTYLGFQQFCLPKNQNGKISWWGKIVYLPFLIFTYVVWHVYRIFSREEPSNRVTQNLFIGRRLLPHENLKKFDCYVDLTAEFEEPTEIRVLDSYICFPILDGGTPEISDLQFFIHRILNKNVFIHCAQGHGRTGLVALALHLASNRDLKLEEGMAMLKAVRPGLSLNRDQLHFIEDNILKIQNPES